MASIAIQNETEYTLTEEMAEQIRRDAQEHFGEAVRSIRVQYGIERHAFNARTGEVRYAFSPNDFGLVDTTTAFPDTYYRPADIPTIDDDTDTEEELTPAAFEDIFSDACGEDGSVRCKLDDGGTFRLELERVLEPTLARETVVQRDGGVTLTSVTHEYALAP